MQRTRIQFPTPTIRCRLPPAHPFWPLQATALTCLSPPTSRIHTTLEMNNKGGGSASQNWGDSWGTPGIQPTCFWFPSVVHIKQSLCSVLTRVYELWCIQEMWRVQQEPGLLRLSAFFKCSLKFWGRPTQQLFERRSFCFTAHAKQAWRWQFISSDMQLSPTWKQSPSPNHHDLWPAVTSGVGHGFYLILFFPLQGLQKSH